MKLITNIQMTTTIISINIMHHFSSNKNEYIPSGSEYDYAKQWVHHQKNIILDLLLKKSNSFEW